jgi:hypothetical protein
MKLKDKLEMVVRELGYKLGERELQERFGQAYHDLKYQHDKALRKLNRLNKLV